MKAFGDWLLLERELDRGMREAGGQTFDRMYKTIMQIINKGVENYLFTIKDEPTPKYDPTDKGRVRAEISKLISRISIIGSFQSGSKVKLDATLFNSTSYFRYLMRDKGEMFFPPNIKFSNFQKYLANSIGLMAITIRSPYGGETWGGSYKTGRKDASFEINMNNFATLYADENSLLHETMDAVLKLRSQGKSANAIIRPINKWIAAFQNELAVKRDLFVHEYIHFLDDMRYKASSDRPGNIAVGIEVAHGAGSDPLKRKYYMSDAETNAYFQGAASEIEDAVKSFLIAATTNRAAALAIQQSNMMIPKFNAMTPQARCSAVGDAVIGDLYRKMNDELREPWVAQHIMKMLDIEPSQTGLKGLHLFCLAIVSWHSFSTSLFSFEDPKNRKKLLSRITTFAQDIEKVIAEYRINMTQGKVPSSQEFNKAMAKFKPGRDPTKSKATYNLLYTGLMMDKKVYDPKKPFTGT
jgi:hypothetical protein